MCRLRRVVVKVGTSVLTGGTGYLDEEYLDELVSMLSRVHEAGVGVVLVTSGAIAVGVRALKLEKRPDDVVLSQVAAAVGQGRLIHYYASNFDKHGITSAQVLLTQDVMDQRERYLNARNALNRMLELGVVPVINENDTVAVEEICFGDNDRLSAIAAGLVEADLLILLSDIPGICTDDPHRNPSATVIEEVECTDERLRNLCGGSAWGRGGVESKVQAAQLASAAGIPTVIAHGREPNVVERIVAGECIGTRFRPRETGIPARKRWILSRPTAGSIIVNKGAAQAITSRGGSLLPAGIIEVRGDFSRGETVAIINMTEVKIGVGISEYDSTALSEIKGLKSADIDALTEKKHPGTAVHRDNMVIVTGSE